MPLTVLFIPNDVEQRTMKSIRDGIATALEKHTGIPAKYCHTVFLPSLFKGTNGPVSDMTFGLIITGFFKWWKPGLTKKGTGAVARVVKAWLENSVEIFALPVNPKLSSLLRLKIDS